MKLKPLDDRLVIERLEPEEKTAGGIVLPDAAKEKPKQGKVIAVGPGKVLESGGRATPAVKAGDKVLFTSYAGTEVKVDGKELLIMKVEDVLAIVEK